MKKYTSILFLSVLISTQVGCEGTSKEEILTKLKIIKDQKRSITLRLDTVLDEEYLEGIQKYMDTLDWFNEKILKNKTNSKGLAKYLKKNDVISEFCSDIFLNESEIELLLLDCQDSLFDFCPTKTKEVNSYKKSLISFLHERLSVELAKKCI